MTRFEKLCSLQEKNGVEIGKNYRNNHACKDFTSSIAETLKSESANQIEKARFISILSDGSTDKGVIEQEIVYVRYVNSQGHVSTKLADIVDLEYGNAKGVKDGIFQGLDTVGLSQDTVADKLVGINTDGAAVNMGKKTGAVKQIIDEIKQFQGDRCENYVTVIHCIAHNLELAVCDAKKNCSI